MLVASYEDDARVLPGVCSVQSLERLASVEALPLPLFKYCCSVKYFNLLIVEIVTGESSLFKPHLLSY